MKKSNYHLYNTGKGEILITDIGPWDKHPTVTNDIENVLYEIRGLLVDNPKLNYIDSEGIICKINYLYIDKDNVKFISFD